MNSAFIKLKYFIASLFLPFISLASADERITHGANTDRNEFPFMAALHSKPNGKGPWQHVCGGALVTQRHVITAAHCYNSADTFSVVLGAHDNTGRGYPQRITVWKWKSHPDYKEKIFKNDIAVLILSKDVDFTKDVNVIALPELEMDNRRTGENCTSIGWGRTSKTGPLPKVLQKAELKILSDSECLQQLKPEEYLDGNSCVYGAPAGACSGDSGSPLVCGNASWPIFFGVVTAGKEPCGGSKKYELYARVGYVNHLEFITNLTSKEVTGASDVLVLGISKLALGSSITLLNVILKGLAVLL